MATKINITSENGTIQVESPYHAEFPARARALAGKFDRGTSRWVFDARDEGRIRDLCRDIYGTDGTESDLVTVRVDLQGVSDRIFDRTLDLNCCGTQVARIFDRDSGARLGDGVVLLSGRVTSGGSRKSPTVVVADGTVIELRDVPRPAAEAEEFATIIDENVDLEALAAEREKLAARIAEIDEVLAATV